MVRSGLEGSVCARNASETALMPSGVGTLVYKDSMIWKIFIHNFSFSFLDFISLIPFFSYHLLSGFISFLVLILSYMYISYLL